MPIRASARASSRRSLSSDSSSVSPTDETTELCPRFGPDGLLTAIVEDADTSETLMLAHMNEAALDATLRSGEATFWSRSRGELWRKGATSGNVLRVVETLIDCDQDAVLLRVRAEGDGVACHTGRRSCFYRSIDSESRTLRFR